MGRFSLIGAWLTAVLSATTSFREVAEQVEAHIINPGAGLLMKNEMLVMCAHVHVKDANLYGFPFKNAV
jgi:hypothetical protein